MEGWGGGRHSHVLRANEVLLSLGRESSRYGVLRNRGLSESTEQGVCDQARGTRKNGWL